MTPASSRVEAIKVLVLVNGLDPFYPSSTAPPGSRGWSASARGSSNSGSRTPTRRRSPARPATALAICRTAGATLVVNDAWRVAIDEGAEWVHLGQEDLDTADLAAIRKAGLRLGVSTRDEAGLERGLAAEPDYVAYGPVFPTISKDQAVASLGLEGLTGWKRRVGPLPLCAIGGIDLDRGEALPRRRGGRRVGHLGHHAQRRSGGARPAWIAATRRATPVKVPAMTARTPIALTIAGSELGRRRGDSGRPEDVRRARRLRRERDHRADRSEHARRPRDPRRPA